MNGAGVTPGKLATLAQGGQHFHRVLDGVVHRYTGPAQYLQRFGFQRRVQTVNDQRLVALLLDRGDFLGRNPFIAGQFLGETNAVAAEHANQKNLIDVAVLTEYFGASRQQPRIGVGAAGDIDRIGQGRLRKQHGAQSLPSDVFQFGQPQARFRKPIGGDGGLSAAVSQDRHAPASGLLQQPQTFGDRQDLVGLADHVDAGLPQHIDGHGIATCQRAGVRTSRFLASGGTARLVDHDRLFPGGFPSDPQEFAAILETLDIQGRNLGVRLLAQIAQVVGEADVGLVARSDIGAETDVAVVLGLQRQGQQHVARLRNDADVAGLDRVQRQQIDLLVQVEQAGGVRADDAYPATPPCFQGFPFQPDAGLAGFAEAAGQDHRALDAISAAQFATAG